MIHFVSNQTFIEGDGVLSATPDEMLNFANKHSVLGFDTETSGLSPLDNKLLLLILGDEKDQFVLDCLSYSPLFLFDVFNSPDITKIAHNMKFDAKFLLKNGIPINNVHCTFLGEEILTKGKHLSDVLGKLKQKPKKQPGNSLAEVLKRRFDIDMDKTQRNTFIGKTSGPFTLGEIRYAAGDVNKLIDLFNIQVQQARVHGLSNVMKIENEGTLGAAEMEFRGMHLNKEKWTKLYETAKPMVDKMNAKLDEIVMTDDLFADFRARATQTDMFTPYEQLRKVEVSWSSVAQVLKVMRKVVPELEGVGVDELTPHKWRHPIISMYLKSGEYRKMVTTYGLDYFKHVDSDGRVRTDFNLIVSTGRVSSRDPNLQQVPAKETVAEVHGDINAYRACFEPGYEDYVFVSADYSSQELALIAHDSQDPVWLEALRKGQDLHSVAAALVYGDKWKEAAEDDCAFYEHTTEQEGGVLVETLAKKKCKCKKHKSLRTGVKTINFGLAYGMSAHKLHDALGISLEEAEELIEQYFNAFPKIKDSLERSAEYGMTSGYIRTMPPFGRIRWFKNWYNRFEGKVRGEIERQSKNTHIQGSGADMTKYAVGKLRHEIIRNNYPVFMVMMVHDQIDTICHKDFALEWKEILVRKMEEAALAIIPSGLLKAEAEICEHWKK